MLACTKKTLTLTFNQPNARCCHRTWEGEVRVDHSKHPHSLTDSLSHFWGSSEAVMLAYWHYLTLLSPLWIICFLEYTSVTDFLNFQILHRRSLEPHNGFPAMTVQPPKNVTMTTNTEIISRWAVDLWKRSMTGSMYKGTAPAIPYPSGTSHKYCLC